MKACAFLFVALTVAASALLMIRDKNDTPNGINIISCRDTPPSNPLITDFSAEAIDPLKVGKDIRIRVRGTYTRDADKTTNDYAVYYKFFVWSKQKSGTACVDTKEKTNCTPQFVKKGPFVEEDVLVLGENTTSGKFRIQFKSKSQTGEYLSCIVMEFSLKK